MNLSFIYSVHNRVFSLSRVYKRRVMLCADMLALPFALWCASVMRYGEWLPQLLQVWWLYIAAPLIAIPCFHYFGLYNAIVRYLGNKAILAVLQGVSLSALSLMALSYFSHAQDIIARSVFVIYWLVAVFYVAGSRYFVRSYYHWLTKKLHKRDRVLIYGAGSAGAQLQTSLLSGQEYLPIAFIDERRNLQGTFIGEMPVYASADIDALINEYDIKEIFLALPHANAVERRRIISFLEPFPVHVRTIPGMSSITRKGKINEQRQYIKEIDVEDLLERPVVKADENLLKACIYDRTVMVTGAGGSIGSELCCKIIQQRPKQLILYEQSEYNLYKVERKLQSLNRQLLLNVPIVLVLGDVKDKKHVSFVLHSYDVKTIYHAAAYKHVPLVEANTLEGIKNNVLGTWYVATAAMEQQVDKFVLISSDKAVRPCNIMGATKRFSELVLQALADVPKQSTYFAMVRFGNVLGSSGSVVPLFREQIRQGGPVTVTHPEVTRYFMSVSEAAELVIQAGALAEGGDVFVLDMGTPVKINDLAKKMIRLMGFQIKDKEHGIDGIEVCYTGLRPGEKLYEEVLIGKDVQGTEHPMILRANESKLSHVQIERYLTTLEQGLEQLDTKKCLHILKQVVTDYACSEQKPDISKIRSVNIA